MQAISLRTRIYFTAIITLAIWSLLAWNYFHGGVPSHHLLARESLPSISNGWGALLLPLLTWFLLYRTSKRTTQTHEKAGLQLNVWIVFGASLLFGIMLSTFFHLWGSRIIQLHAVLSVYHGFVFSSISRGMFAGFCDRDDIHLWCGTTNVHWFYTSDCWSANISANPTSYFICCLQVYTDGNFK